MKIMTDPTIPNCNHCGRKTDALKLKTIENKDFLVCKECSKEIKYAKASDIGVNFSGVPGARGQRGNGIQQLENGVPAARLS